MNSKGEYNRCQLPRLIIEGTQNDDELPTERSDSHKEQMPTKTTKTRSKYKRGNWEWGAIKSSNDPAGENGDLVNVTNVGDVDVQKSGNTGPSFSNDRQKKVSQKS